VDVWDDATDAAPGDGCKMVNKWLFDGDDDGMLLLLLTMNASSRQNNNRPSPTAAHKGQRTS
jgi:hypothetical protein